MLRRLQGDAVPRLLGHDGHRVLLADIPGEDQYDADEPELLRWSRCWSRSRRPGSDGSTTCCGMALPDWRGPGLTAGIADVVQRRSADLPPADADALAAFVEGLPARFAAIEACGLPDTLVHGDFHPGNVRGTPGNLTMLNWGDCGVGHPLLDLPGVPRGRARGGPASGVPVALAQRLDVRPCGARNAARAGRLLAPVAAARQAVIYQTFVDKIEPVERRHHDVDAVEWLSRTAGLAGDA